MKKLLGISILFFGMLFFLACQKDKGATFYEVSVEVEYPQGYDPDSRAGIPVKMINMITGVEVEEPTNAQGLAEFLVEAGNYNITVVYEDDEFAFNGILENRSVTTDGHQFRVNILMVAKTGGLVISEVFFAGSVTPENTNYNNDVFVEIYNNSDEIIYMDGLCIGIHAANSLNPSQWVDAQGEILTSIPITFQSWILPGTGQTYPLAPRTAAVIAVDGINHKELNSNSFDLSTAAFEAKVDHTGDVDNPNVPNMIIMYTTSPAMNNWSLDVNGKAVIIWRLPTGVDYQPIVDDASNFMKNPTTGSGFLMFMVKQEWVVDAVEIVRPEEDRRHKQLRTEVDAGMVWNPSDKGRGHSVRRKVDKVIEGKVYLRNSKNSSVDWIGGAVPTPGQVPTSVD